MNILVPVTDDSIIVDPKITTQFVRPDGTYVGGYGDGAIPTDADAYPFTAEQLINIGEDVPEYADQIYLFPGWAPSRMKQVLQENAWREHEIQVIANQLMALEEAESAAEEGMPPPDDLLPGTRAQWLSYRTKVRAWKEGGVGFPTESLRPVSPAN